MISPQGQARSKLRKSLYRLVISKQDFERCARDLNSSQGPKVEESAKSAFLLSAVIHYARPFSPNETHAKARADSRIDPQVLLGLNFRELALHRKIITLRNKAVAHAEWKYNKTVLRKNRILEHRQFWIGSYVDGGVAKRFYALGCRLWSNCDLLESAVRRELEGRK